MSSQRKLLGLLLAAAIVGAPAAILRSTCSGNACRQTASAAVRVPFCSLPAETKLELQRGYRQGRSPDVMAVTATRATEDSGHSMRPSLRGEKTVPIGFLGLGVNPGADIGVHARLDDVAPTIAQILGLRRPHPDVRSGEPLPGVADGARPRLVLEIAGIGIGGQGRAAARFRRPLWRVLQQHGAVTFAGRVGSLPDDPAAVLTTIGTGGMPSQHGITGRWLRNDEGEVVRAWGPGSPLPVIAGLGDDLDRRWHQSSRIGVVARDITELGIAGGNWYAAHDRDDLRLVHPSGVAGARSEERAVHALLRSGYGKDRIPDLLAVVLDVPGRQFATSAAHLYRAAQRETDGRAILAVAGTGVSPEVGFAARRVARRLERSLPGDRSIVTRSTTGGSFLDQGSLGRASISNDVAAGALRRQQLHGAPMFADAFTGTAISFAKYC